MAVFVTEDQWKTVRTSLRETTERFAEMVTSASDPQVKATVSWSVAEMAAHVTAVAWLDAMLLDSSMEPLPIPGLAERLRVTTVDGVHDLNSLTLRHFTERDPEALATMLRDHVSGMLDHSEGLSPDQPVTWLGGSRVPVAGLLAHLLNELLIHGYDIARPTRTPWTIAPEDAAPFFELFIVGLVHNDVAGLLDGGGAASERRVAVEFRSDHTTPITLVLRNGRVTSEPPGGETDVRMFFDPATLNLMMFGRVGRMRAVLTRKVVLGGRRPWLLPVFLRTVRVPS